jgi:GNAT superfamily N-acetyltransferase
MTILYREAISRDSGLILELIKELAQYEKLENEVVATEASIQETLFGSNPKAFAYVIENNDTPISFAVCFYNYSTFQGRAGIYLEDLYIREEYRGQGIGKGFFKILAERALQENCGRLQWWVLDWNEPSIQFYKKLGATDMKEWITMRIEGDQAIKDLVNIDGAGKRA